MMYTAAEQPGGFPEPGDLVLDPAGPTLLTVYEVQEPQGTPGSRTVEVQVDPAEEPFDRWPRHQQDWFLANLTRVHRTAGLRRADRNLYPPYTQADAGLIGDAIGIDWSTVEFSVDQFLAGLNVEFEHGTKNPETDVTQDDPLVTGKIAWAHLKEKTDYYESLAQMESTEETAMPKTPARKQARAHRQAVWSFEDSKSHSPGELERAVIRGETLWLFDSGTSGNDDILAYDTSVTEPEVEQDLLAFFELNAWPEQWSLRPLSADEANDLLMQHSQSQRHASTQRRAVVQRCRPTDCPDKDPADKRWCLLTHDKKKALKCAPSREEAEQHEKAVNYFSHQGRTAMIYESDPLWGIYDFSTDHIYDDAEEMVRGGDLPDHLPYLITDEDLQDQGITVKEFLAEFGADFVEFFKQNAHDLIGRSDPGDGYQLVEKAVEEWADDYFNAVKLALEEAGLDPASEEWANVMARVEESNALFGAYLDWEDWASHADGSGDFGWLDEHGIAWKDIEPFAYDRVSNAVSEAAGILLQDAVRKGLDEFLSDA
jgi:hypothetical protein